MLTNRNGLGRRTGDRDWRETLPGPAYTFPGTEAKIREMERRAAGEMDLYDADDPCISNETGEIIGGKKAAVGEEVELLQQMGYQGGWEGGVFFVTAFVLPLERGQLLLLQEKEVREGRHRTDREKAKAATPEFRAREAARKAAERERERARKRKGGIA